jgi:HSP20 family protein
LQLGKNPAPLEEIYDNYSLGSFRDVVALQNRMNSLFQDFSRNGENELVAAGFVPPVDIYEDEHKLVLKLEIPGMRLEDLDVRMENNTLGKGRAQLFKGEGKEENFHRVERRYGAFYRAFTIPNTIDPDSIKAEYDAGCSPLGTAEEAGKQAQANQGKCVSRQAAEPKSTCRPARRRIIE